MIRFSSKFWNGIRNDTFFESCGVADLITTCFGGRNRKVAEAFVRSRKSIEDLEIEILNGQKLQGPSTAKDISDMLRSKGCEAEFPLFVSVYKICYEGMPPELLVYEIGNVESKL